MGNFELIDNLFQIILLFCAAVSAGVLALRYKSRRLLTISLAYVCFAMGTTYYVLYLVIIGIWPQVFYVAEFSWLAAWLFYLSVQLLRREKTEHRFSWISGSVAAVIGLVAFFDRAFGPSYLISALFALTAGATAYLAVLRIQSGGLYRETDILMTGCAILQVLL